jgi:hypothetical protein
MIWLRRTIAVLLVVGALAGFGALVMRYDEIPQISFTVSCFGGCVILWWATKLWENPGGKPGSKYSKPVIRRTEIGSEDERSIKTAGRVAILLGSVYTLLLTVGLMTIEVKDKLDFNLHWGIGCLGPALLAAGILIRMRNRAGTMIFMLLSPILVLLFPIGTLTFFTIRKYLNLGRYQLTFKTGGIPTFLVTMGLIILMSYSMVRYRSPHGVLVAWYQQMVPAPKPAVAPAPAPVAPRPTSPAPAPVLAAAPAPPPSAKPSNTLFAGTEAATQEAVRLYPSLKQKGSPLQVKFSERVKQYQATQPAYFQDKTWPLKLANELAKE